MKTSAVKNVIFASAILLVSQNAFCLTKTYLCSVMSRVGGKITDSFHSNVQVTANDRGVTRIKLPDGSDPVYGSLGLSLLDYADENILTISATRFDKSKSKYGASHTAEGSPNAKLKLFVSEEKSSVIITCRPIS